MHDLLLKKISERVNLKDEEREIIKKYFMPKKLKKRQFLLQEGNICDRFTFVTKGVLVGYSIDERGTEHVISFAFEGCWAGDLISLFSKQPSKLHIEALEKCELLQLVTDDQESLFAEVPSYERYTRINYQNVCVAFQKRIESCLGLTAQEKYDRLFQQTSLITKSIPLNLIASYLGIAPETLSRLRKTRSPFASFQNNNNGHKSLLSYSVNAGHSC